MPTATVAPLAFFKTGRQFLSFVLALPLSFCAVPPRVFGPRAGSGLAPAQRPALHGVPRVSVTMRATRGQSPSRPHFAVPKPGMHCACVQPLDISLKRSTAIPQQSVSMQGCNEAVRTCQDGLFQQFSSGSQEGIHSCPSRLATEDRTEAKLPLLLSPAFVPL